MNLWLDTGALTHRINEPPLNLRCLEPEKLPTGELESKGGQLNIMIIDHYAGSEKMGMSYRPYFLAKQWISQGHKVVIVCASFSHLRRKNPLIGEDLKEEVEDKITYVYLNTPTYAQSSSGNMGKERNIHTFVRKLTFHSRNLCDKYKPDVVIASSTYPFDCVPARKIAAKAHAALIYEIHDLFPLSLNQLYHYKEHSIAAWQFKHAQKKAVKYANSVVSVIAHANKYLSEIGIQVEDYHYIPNGAHISALKASPHPYPKSHVDIIEKWRSQGKFVVVYLGTMVEINQVEVLIDAAKKLTAEIQVALIGNGVERSNLKKKVAHAHINNVHFLDVVPKACTQEILRHADCLYLGTKNVKLYEYGMGMNKIYDYMLSGRPILFATDSKENPVMQSGCGLIVKSENAEELIKGIVQMKALSPKELEEMGKKGQDYCIKNHDYQILAQQFLSVIHGVTQANQQSYREEPAPQI